MNSSLFFLPRFVGIVAATAGASPPVFIAVYSDHCAPCTVWIFELLVTSEAQFPAFVDRECFLLVRMAGRGTVAILALDVLVNVAVVRPDLLIMAFDTCFLAKILDGKRLPFADIAEPMEAVGKIAAMDAEVVGHQEHPGEQHQHDQGNGYPKWVKYMSFHP